MLELKIDLSDLANFAAKMPEVNQAIENEQRAAMYASLSVLEQAVTVRTPVNAGTARQGWTTQVTGTPARLLGELFNPVAYALPVETGRRPGKQPPIETIQLWVTRKLGLTGKDARSAAFLIARAIGRRGTKGAYMLRDGWAQAEPLIIRLHEAIPAKALAKLQI